MGAIDDACRKFVEATDGALACGVVDLRSGILLGIHNAANFTAKMNDVVAAATLDMFRGSSISRIAQMVKRNRGDKEKQKAPAEHYIEEMQLTSRNNHHFAKCSRDGSVVVMLVTERSTSAGLGWSQVRAALTAVEPLLS
jgi:hypothetical protein